MTLAELREVRRVIQDHSADWQDVISGRELRPHEVSLYNLNYNWIAPETVVTHCFLKGLTGSIRAGQVLVQSNPPALKHYKCPMAKGLVEQVLEDSVKVSLLVGRFAAGGVAGEARVTAHQAPLDRQTGGLSRRGR